MLLELEWLHGIFTYPTREYHGRQAIVFNLFTNIWAAWKHETLQDPQDILDQALQLDIESRGNFANASAAWDLKTLNTDTASIVILSGCYHVYPDPMVARTWNAVRGMRTMLNAMIRDIICTVENPDLTNVRESEHTVQLQVSTNALLELQFDIIANTLQYATVSRPSSYEKWFYIEKT